MAGLWAPITHDAPSTEPTPQTGFLHEPEPPATSAPQQGHSSSTSELEISNTENRNEIKVSDPVTTSGTESDETPVQVGTSEVAVKASKVATATEIAPGQQTSAVKPSQQETKSGGTNSTATEGKKVPPPKVTEETPLPPGAPPPPPDLVPSIAPIFDKKKLEASFREKQAAEQAAEPEKSAKELAEEERIARRQRENREREREAAQLWYKAPAKRITQLLKQSKEKSPDRFLGVLEGGVPKEHRAEWWRKASNLEDTCNRNRGVYWQLATETEESPIDDQTLLRMQSDVTEACSNRPEFEDFKEKAFGILKVYWRYRPSLTFNQGLAYLVCTAIEYFPDEEEAFWVTVLLLERFGVHVFYNPECLKEFSRVFPSCLPTALAQYIEDSNIMLSSYLDGWLTTLFTKHFRPEVSCSIIDLLWISPKWMGMHIRIAAALHTEWRDEILKTKGQSVTSVLGMVQNRIPKETTREILVKALCRKNYFYFTHDLPTYVTDCLAKADNLDQNRSKQLQETLTKEYVIDEASEQQATTPQKSSSSSDNPFSKFFRSVKGAVAGDAKATTGNPQLQAKPAAKKKCPYHMYPCNCMDNG